MNTPASSPAERHSNRSWKWIERGLLLTCAALLILSCTVAFHQIRRKANKVRAQVDTMDLVAVLDQYAAEFGGLPEGSSVDILRMLRGDNQRKIVFFNPHAGEVNPDGEIIDPWEQPYHFDLSVPSGARVYSSGPNRIDEHGAKGSDDIVCESPKRRAQIDANNLAEVVDRYAMTNGYRLEGPRAGLLRTLRGRTRRKLEFIDPWGQPYHLDLSDPSSPRVYSSGPNRIDEHGAKGSDDIVGESKLTPPKPAQLPTPQS